MPMDYETTDRAKAVAAQYAAAQRYASDGPATEAPTSNLRHFEDRLGELQMSLDDLVSTVSNHADRAFGFQNKSIIDSGLAQAKSPQEPSIDQRLYRIETTVQNLRVQINRF